ncbi:unnamed protein product [Schistosoma mattheei]|uniref:Uncharacterized protein n=1 Tax=Schistosoma mattheei TaxID=31246 RepID=A0AA85B582_9TREM|nr:unnamed protein product [Schistosoma mattheei]
MLKPSDPQNITSSCELFTPYGITPGLVKQVREKFQSEISMNELSRNIQSGVKHHSATARLTCAYQNLLHSDNGIQRHNTYPNRRIQSTGRVSDLPTPTSLTAYKVNGRPRTESFLDTLKPSRESFTSQVRVGESGKSTAPVHPNEYRTQTAISGHRIENTSRYNNLPSNISSVEQDEGRPINHDLLNSNENKNKPKESKASSSTKNNTRTDFKQPAILPKPSKKGTKAASDQINTYIMLMNIPFLKNQKILLVKRQKAETYKVGILCSITRHVLKIQVTEIRLLG